MDPTNTLFKIVSGMGQPLYAARGLTQTLEPIDAAIQIERDVNALLVDLSWDNFRKYKSEVFCMDVETPSFDNVWPGQIVVIDCALELSYLTSGGSPGRTVVSGSSRIEGSYTFYRPRLTCMFMGFATSLDEYPADYRWVARFEEQ